MSSFTMMRVRDLHPQIICPLCSGYFVDATTIVECLHSFCRSCIVRYLETSKYCPICDIEIHKSKPLLNIRPDKTLQDIVFKLVPGLFDDEMRRRMEFYALHPESEPADLEENGRVAILADRRYQVYSSNDKISVALSPRDIFKTEPDAGESKSDKRYFLCPSMVTIGHMKHLIKSKFDHEVRETMRVEIYWKNAQLPESYTLLDVGYSYPWNRSRPMELTYQILDTTKVYKPPPTHFTSWKFKKKKRKKKKRSASASGDLYSPSGSRKKKRRKRDRSSSLERATNLSVKSAPAATEDATMDVSSSSPPENPPVSCDKPGGREEEVGGKTPSPKSEEEAKENRDNFQSPKAVESREQQATQPETESAAEAQPISDTKACDNLSESVSPVAKADERVEPAKKLRVNDPLEAPKPIEAREKVCATPPPAPPPRVESPPHRDQRELRKRKKCLAPVIQNGSAEREEIRGGAATPSIFPPLPLSPLFPWSTPTSTGSGSVSSPTSSPWAQYYHHYNHHLHSSFGSGPSPGSPMLPLPPSPLHSPSPYLPPLPPPPPAHSPFSPTDFRIPLPSNSPVPPSFHSSYSSSTSSPWNSFSSSTYRHFQSSLHHSSPSPSSPYFPPHLQHHTYTTTNRWDKLDFSAIFDFSRDRDRIYKNGLPPPSSSALSPPNSLPPLFSPHFRPNNSSMFTPSSIFPTPLSPLLDRELPKH